MTTSDLSGTSNMPRTPRAPAPSPSAPVRSPSGQGPSPTLDQLAAGRATGALYTDAGALYLVRGQVVHAESPAAPTLDELLIRAGRLAAEGWQRAVDRGGARGQVASALVEGGLLARGELEICHLGALFDAAYFALAPPHGPARFRSGAGHWLGTIRPVTAEAVKREVARRRRLLDAVWPYPAVDHAPLRPSDRAGGGVRSVRVPRRHRAVLALADGVRTPTVIAHALGRPASHTLLDVRRLAAAGCVETPRQAPDHDQQPAPAPAAPGPAPSPALSAEISALHKTAGPDIALLRRVRDALEEKL